MDRFDWLEMDGVSSAPSVKSVKVETPPRDGPSFLRAARRMRQAGHFQAAVDLYRSAIGFNDQDFTACVELVDTLVRSKQIDAADVASHDALENYRKVRQLYASRTLVLAHQGRFAEAQPLSDISVEGDDRPWYARCVRAELLLRLNTDHRFTALELIEEAVPVSDRPWECYLLAGWMFLDAALPALAASHFTEAAHRNPRAAVCWLGLGDCFRDLRFYEQAMFYYQRVGELEPSHDAALERQKRCAPNLFGLMRGLRKEPLIERWNREFDKILKQAEPDPDDF